VFRVFLVSLILSIACGCHRNSPQETHSPPDVRSRYIRRLNGKSVIVFVHGIFGDAQATWANPDSQAYWPELLTNDDAFTDADIYVLAFNSPYLRGATTIDELVEQAHQDLIADEVFSAHRRVIFLCHSMGGLVTRKMLTRYQPLAESVPLIYFFATPTEGAEITRLASVFSKNPQITGMSPADADNYVTVVQRDWRAAKFHVTSRCAYEEKATMGVQIVKQMSASMLCDGPVLPIESDHIGIVKPFNKDDKSYVAFRTAYRDALTKPEDVPAVSAAESEVSTAALTTRPLEVACGASSDQTITVPFTAAQHPGQRLVDAVVSMQQRSNLKSRFAEVKNRTANEVEVHYRIEGLDQDRSGKCASIGRATLTVAFLLAGPPASAKPADTAQTRISQSTRGDFSPAVAGVAGNLTIIRNAEPQSNVPSASVTVTPPSAPLSPLTLAMSPSMQGLLLDQRTRGNLSPALAAIGGSVLVVDNAPAPPKKGN
jgi:hypothetical protein